MAYIVVWNITSTWFQKFVYDKGYELGGSAVELIVGQQATAFRESVIVMGQVIVGAMAASWVNVSSSVQIATNSEGKPVMLIDQLNGAFPKILTMAFVLLAWFLMAKKNMSPIKVLLLFVVIAIVGNIIGSDILFGFGSLIG